jgi:hypothetical protein
VSGLDAGLQVIQHVVQLVVPGRLTKPPYFHFYSATWRFLYSSEKWRRKLSSCLPCAPQTKSTSIFLRPEIV